tara:strand:- start:736 stop:1539 length:804 start_codon:yes stop_codon:yes gene_type:complete
MFALINVIKDILRFIYYRFFNKLFYTNKLEVNYTISEEDNSIFKEIQQNGYSIIDNFISKDECNSIIQEIDLFCDNRFDEVTLFEGFDNRIYGLNKASTKVNSFLNNERLVNILGKYAENKKLTFSFTLGQKTIFKEKNSGSGLGWHIDHTVLKYPKALVYLVDVNKDNGPFQYIKGTNKLINKILIRLKNNYNFDKGKFTNHQVEEIIKKNNYYLKTFCLKAGTLILFDGNGIHRGSPLNLDKRYSLTNYYYFSTTGGNNFPMIKK